MEITISKNAKKCSKLDKSNVVRIQFLIPTQDKTAIQIIDQVLGDTLGKYCDRVEYREAYIKDKGRFALRTIPIVTNQLIQWLFIFAGDISSTTLKISHSLGALLVIYGVRRI